MVGATVVVVGATVVVVGATVVVVGATVVVVGATVVVVGATVVVVGATVVVVGATVVVVGGGGVPTIQTSPRGSLPSAVNVRTVLKNLSCDAVAVFQQAMPTLYVPGGSGAVDGELLAENRLKLNKVPGRFWTEPSSPVVWLRKAVPAVVNRLNPLPVGGLPEPVNVTSPGAVATGTM